MLPPRVSESTREYITMFTWQHFRASSAFVLKRAHTALPKYAPAWRTLPGFFARGPITDTIAYTPSCPPLPPTGGCNQAIGTGAHRTATTRAWGVPAPNSPTRVVLRRLRRQPMARQVRRVVVAPVPLVALPAAPVQARRSRLQLTITRDRCVTRASMRCSLIPPNRLTRCWRVCVWLCMGATGGQAGQED